ncbi:MAG: dimethylamine/trimethylamine dehydrogenase [Granulosicoccus sp.]
MSRDPIYDVLFDEVQIGPVTAPNRFYQVPHCSGMGYRYPQSEARFRGIKAEGGWGVVSTQETEIHPTSDLTPANEGRLWDERDIPSLKLMTDAVHEHGSLAAVQLVHNGLHSANRYSREIPIAPSAAIVDQDDPVHAREMSIRDIKTFRQWHKDAAIRAKQAGFDIVYVYAGHDMSLLQHFLLQRHNHRTDEYGGSLANRLRLFREVIADTRDAVGDTCAVAVRLPVDELMGAEGLQYDGEARDIIEALAEEPDLWDVNLSNWSNDSQSSRFSEEGYQEKYTAFVKSVTSKPVVGVGRYTSPDSMVRVVKQGILDLVGAARPSIADPFLPNKIFEGRIDDIRECIGCNICITGDNTNVPMRCTQNPVVGEEWRRGWHPERVERLVTVEHHLVIGGGPAGLEAARALGQRGATVTMAEAGDTWGGRVTLESALPGLGAWARVRDWRLHQLRQMPNVNMYLQSELSASDILEYDIPHIVIATGSSWRRDGVGRANRRPLSFLSGDNVITPDDLMQRGVSCLSDEGPVIIFDDDRFYMASVLAEMIAQAGFETVYVSPSPVVAAWTEQTLEQGRIQKRLIQLGVKLVLSHNLSHKDSNTLALACCYSGNITHIPCKNLVTATSRIPTNQLWHELSSMNSTWKDAGVKTVQQIGDCVAPGIIATAVQNGYAYAQAAGATHVQVLKREDISTH